MSEWSLEPPVPNAPDTPPTPSAAPGWGGWQPEQFPIVVRYNPVMGVVLIALGLLNLFMAAAVEGFKGSWFIGIGLPIIGALLCFGTCVIVDPTRVRVKSPVGLTIKDEQIRGLADLYFDGDKLYLAAGNRRLVNLGWGSVRPAERLYLKQAVASARR